MAQQPFQQLPDSATPDFKSFNFLAPQEDPDYQKGTSRRVGESDNKTEQAWEKMPQAGGSDSDIARIIESYDRTAKASRPDSKKESPGLSADQAEQATTLLKNVPPMV